MERPLNIGSVHNMSLESFDNNNEYPHLVAHFSYMQSPVLNSILVAENFEVGYAAIHLHDGHNVSLEGISLTVQTPNISGLILVNVSNIHVQLNILCLSMLPPSQIDKRTGVLMYKADIVEVYLSHVSNCSSGFVLASINSIRIVNTTALYNNDTGLSLTSTTIATVIDIILMHNRYNGLVVLDTADFTVSGTTIAHNGGDGMYLADTAGISVINSTVLHNRYFGMELLNTTTVSIVNTSVMDNGHDRVYPVNSTTVSSTNTTTMPFVYSGMYVGKTTRIRIINTTVMHNGYEGMYIEHTVIISIIDTTVLHNGQNGMYLVNTTNARIINTTVMYSAYDGMYVVNSTNVSIIKTTVMQTGQMGVGLVNTTGINIFNTTVMQNGHEGMGLLNTATVIIINTSVIDNGHNRMYPVNSNVTGLPFVYSGMYVGKTTRIRILNTTVMHNGYEGMYIEHTVTISIIDTTVLHNGHNGMYLVNTTNTRIINTTVMYSAYDGMYVVNSTNVSIIKTNVMQTGQVGVGLENTTGINIFNTTVMQNGHEGMGLLNTTNISIINTTALLNGHYGMNLRKLTNCNISSTTAMHNGIDGIFLWYALDISIINTSTTNNKNAGIFSYFTVVCFVVNTAVVGNGNQGILLYGASEFYIVNTTLMLNGWRRAVTTVNGDVLSTADPTSLPAVIVLLYSSVHVSGCIVTNSNVSAIKAYSSNISAFGDVIISNNRAITGAAFVFVQNSILKLKENAHIQIMNNHAINTGGAFYITGEQHYNVISTLLSVSLVADYLCFFKTEGSRSQRKFTFENNSAGKGGDILYGGHVFYGLDGDWNCLLSFKNISNISQSGLSLITSDPSRVCLCKGSGQPDCLIVADPTTHYIYPGQSINLSAVVVGQDFGTVSGLVYAQFLQNVASNCSPQLGTGQEIQDVMQRTCNNLSYTIFSPGDMSEAVLVLTTNNRIVSQFVAFEGFEDVVEWDLESLYNVHDPSALNAFKYGHYPLYVNISFLPCPAGFMLTTKPPFRCDCSQLLQRIEGVKCYIPDQTISRSGLVWVGTLKEDNGTVVASEYCLFDYCNKEDSNVTLSDPDPQCNYNHSGTLCGGCQPDLSLALGSAQCLQCSNNYLALLIPFALAGPALVFFVKTLDLTISQGTVNGLIFYANIVKANDYMLFSQRQTNPLTLFIAWFNLDLGVETCFFHGLSAYTKTWLQFVFPLYIWSIAGLIIILAKYSDRVAKVMGNNSVPVLATLFLLSYAKLFRTIITALSYTMLYSSQGHKAVWSADGNVDYLGPKHAPLFTVAVAALLFLWLPYTLLLFLGQWLHRCNCQLIDHTLMKIKPFLDAHYGPLKGKHRYWFGALLIARAAILLMSALIPTNHAVLVNFSTSICAVVLNYFGLIVYRSITVAMYDIFFFMNLALLGLTSFFTTAVGRDQTVAVYVLIGVAFVQFLGLIILKVFSILRRSEKVMACLHKRQPAEDDWELYEEAALQREIVSDTEEEESNGFGSTESLPTY